MYIWGCRVVSILTSMRKGPSAHTPLPAKRGLIFYLSLLSISLFPPQRVPGRPRAAAAATQHGAPTRCYYHHKPVQHRGANQILSEDGRMPNPRSGYCPIDLKPASGFSPHPQNPVALRSIDGVPDCPRSQVQSAAFPLPGAGHIQGVVQKGFGANPAPRSPSRKSQVPGGAGHAGWLPSCFTKATTPPQGVLKIAHILSCKIIFLKQIIKRPAK